MADDTERLVVELEARIRDFEKNFEKATKKANDEWSKIENRGKQAAQRMQSDMAKAAAGVTSSISSIGSQIAGSFGLTGIASLTGFLALAVKINGELAKLDGLARRANLSTDRLQQVKFAANVRGVSDEDFSAGIDTSLKLLDEAQRQVNSLQRLFNANGLSIKQNNGELLQFDQLLEQAARLMAGARTEQQRIKIAEMLGLSREWVGLLRNGPEAFRKLADEAENAGAVIDKETIARAKEFDKKWHEAVIRFKAGMTEALTDLSAEFGKFWSELIDQVPGANFIRDTFNKWFGGLRGMSIPELKEAVQRAIDDGMQFEADRIQAEIDRRLGKTPLKIKVTPEVTDQPATVIPRDGNERNRFERAVFEANKRIAATDAETKTIGLNTEARERAKLVAELEEAAKRANTEAGFQNATVTEAQRQKINQLADAMEAAAKRQRESQQRFEAFNETLKFGGNIAIEFLDKLGDKTAKFADLLKSAMDMLKKAALQALVLGEGPLSGIFGTKSTVTGGTGGIFGLLGNLFGASKADGGIVRGPGGPRADRILTPTSNGEFVVNAAATARNRALLDAINRGVPSASLPVPAIPGASVAGARINAPSITQNVANTINVTGGGGTDEQNEALAKRIAQQIEDKVNQSWAENARQQLRPGGMFRR
jgi:hypothetical protein